MIRVSIKNSLHRRSIFRVLAVSLAAITGVSGCSKTNSSAGLAFSVSPSTATIINTTESTCVDKANYQIAGSSSTGTAAVLARSAAAAHITFPNFILQWTSTTESLYISDMTIVLQSSALPNGKQTITLDPGEFEDLIGNATLVVPPAPSGGSQLYYSNPNTSDTKQPQKDKTLFAPCGLVIGGITIPSGVNSFTVSVLIVVEGEAITTDGNSERYVRQTYTATANYDQNY